MRNYQPKGEKIDHEPYMAARYIAMYSKRLERQGKGLLLRSAVRRSQIGLQYQGRTVILLSALTAALVKLSLLWALNLRSRMLLLKSFTRKHNNSGYRLPKQSQKCVNIYLLCKLNFLPIFRII
jgi:hypothetical protein